MFGSLVSKALDYGLDYLGVKQAQSFSNSAASEAYARQKDMYQHRYQWTVDDMKKAGLNPIMAASGGFSVGGAPSVASAQSFQQHSTQPMSSTALDYAREEKTREETTKVSEETDKIHNEINLILSQIAKTDNESAKISQEISNLMVQYEKIGTDIRSQELNNTKKAVLLKYIHKIEKNLDSLIEFTELGQAEVQSRLRELWNQLKNATKEPQGEW